MARGDAKSSAPPGPRGPAARLSIAVATVFGIGYVPVAPGTWGTAAAIPLVLGGAALPQWVYIALCVAVTAVAIAAAAGADRAFGVHDSGRIVVDEVAGYFWTMVPASHRADPIVLLAGFILFRAADIGKPPPARAIDRRLPGGPGVVLDDVVAGLWAAAALWAIERAGWLDGIPRPW